MLEGFQKLDLIIYQELANRFGVKLLIDDFETNFTQLFVVSFVDGGGQTISDFLKVWELVDDSFMRLIHAVFFDI